MSSAERSLAAAAEGGRPGAPELSRMAEELARELERAIAERGAEALSSEALRRLVPAVCKAYAARVQSGAELTPFGPETSLSDTEVMILASALLRAANLQVFELGMWQSWTGR